MRHTHLPSSRRLLALSLQLTFAFSAAISVHAQEATRSAEQKNLSDPAWIAAGREKFIQTCAYCHGQEGDAGKHRPFRERVDWDPDLIHDVIANGRKRGANVMPSWNGAISDEDIWKITAYIRSLGGKPRPVQ